MKKIMLSLLFATMFCSGLFSGLIILNKTDKKLTISANIRSGLPDLGDTTLRNNKAYYHPGGADFKPLRVMLQSNYYGNPREEWNIDVPSNKMRIMIIKASKNHATHHASLYAHTYYEQ